MRGSLISVALGVGLLLLVTTRAQPAIAPPDTRPAWEPQVGPVSEQIKRLSGKTVQILCYVDIDGDTGTPLPGGEPQWRCPAGRFRFSGRCDGWQRYGRLAIAFEGRCRQRDTDYVAASQRDDTRLEPKLLRARAKGLVQAIRGMG